MTIGSHSHAEENNEEHADHEEEEEEENNHAGETNEEHAEHEEEEEEEENNHAGENNEEEDEEEEEGDNVEPDFQLKTSRSPAAKDSKECALRCDTYNSQQIPANCPSSKFPVGQKFCVAGTTYTVTKSWNSVGGSTVN